MGILRAHMGTIGCIVLSVGQVLKNLSDWKMIVFCISQNSWSCVDAYKFFPLKKLQKQTCDVQRAKHRMAIFIE